MKRSSSAPERDEVGDGGGPSGREFGLAVPRKHRPTHRSISPIMLRDESRPHVLRTVSRSRTNVARGASGFVKVL